MKILVISLRYLGDVLLATPLIHALRRAYPEAAIDALVFAGTEGMLEGNPDVRRVLAAESKPRLWRRYDLSVVAGTGDRPHVYGWLAAPRRAGLLPPEWSKRWWKRLLVRQGVVSPEREARLQAFSKLARTMGLEWQPQIIAPSAGMTGAAWRPLLGFNPDAQRYAVIHIAPRFRYKRWHAEGWRALIVWLRAQGLPVVLTGGPGEEEREYVQSVLAGAGTRVIDLSGRLGFGQVADLLRRAAVYIGPDTSTTHLAAACATPAVALFGPTDPRLWGPQPATGLERPYEKVAALQIRGNVALVQEPSQVCVPCQLEGCERHRQSHSDCLDAMQADRVIEAVRARLQAAP